MLKFSNLLHCFKVLTYQTYNSWQRHVAQQCNKNRSFLFHFYSDVWISSMLRERVIVAKVIKKNTLHWRQYVCDCIFNYLPERSTTLDYKYVASLAFKWFYETECSGEVDMSLTSLQLTAGITATRILSCTNTGQQVITLLPLPDAKDGVWCFFGETSIGANFRT